MSHPQRPFLAIYSKVAPNSTPVSVLLFDFIFFVVFIITWNYPPHLFVYSKVPLNLVCPPFSLLCKVQQRRIFFFGGGCFFQLLLHSQSMADSLVHSRYSTNLLNEWINSHNPLLLSIGRGLGELAQPRSSWFGPLRTAVTVSGLVSGNSNRGEGINFNKFARNSFY